MCHAVLMGMISHRELRNHSGRILQAVSSGESFTVTNNNTPVARIVPLDAAVPELRCVRPSVQRGGFAQLERYVIQGTVGETVDELRGER